MRGVSDAVFRFLIDFLLRMVGTEVALAAGFRLACLCRREAVPAVAGRAGAERTVRIQPADAGIRPGLGRRAVVAVEFHRAAVALQATGIDRRRAADDFAHDVVERGEDLAASGMVRGLLLVDFPGVAGTALFRGDHGCDEYRLVLVFLVRIGARLAFIGLVAVVATDTRPAVGALLPFADEARIVVLMTGNAFLADGDIGRRFYCFHRFAAGSEGQTGRQQEGDGKKDVAQYRNGRCL